MTLYEELYFDITLEGAKSDIKRFVSALEAGALDDFFEYDSEQLDYDDDFESADDEKETSLSFSNVDIGIEIEEISLYDLLDQLCKISKSLEVRGEIYDIDDDEYRFVSHSGDSYYINADKERLFEEDIEAENDDDTDEI